MALTNVICPNCDNNLKLAQSDYEPRSCSCLACGSMDFAAILAKHHPGKDIYDYLRVGDLDEQGNFVLDVEATKQAITEGKAQLKLENDTYIKSFLVTTMLKAPEEDLDFLSKIINQFSGINFVEIADRDLNPKKDYIAAYVYDFDPFSPEDAAALCKAMKRIKGVRSVEASVNCVPRPPEEVLTTLKEASF